MYYFKWMCSVHGFTHFSGIPNIMKHYSFMMMQKTVFIYLFIPQNELIDMAIFQDLIISPSTINKQTKDSNKLTVIENKQKVS